jgi:hypothetical protein
MLLFHFCSRGQIVNEEVHFDYYVDSTTNDFTNHFSGGYGMEQVTTNGITGGCLQVPDSISWGNDNAVYCSRFKPQAGDTVFAAVSFKYDSATIHPLSYQRAMSIWLIPSLDFNHYLIATVSGDKKIELLTYGWNNNPYPLLTLHSNHWYRYELSLVFINAQDLSVNASVYDLGLTGTSTPVLVNSGSGNFTDNILAMDTSIQVSITGATYGGTKYLDDFQFTGREGVTSCINVPTAVSEEPNQLSLLVYPSPASEWITIELSSKLVTNGVIEIYNMDGRKQLTVYPDKQKTLISCRKLLPGMYFIHFRSGTTSGAKSLVISR